MLEQSLDTAIQNGEDSFTEFKQELTSPEQIASEIVAFANAEGGTIYFGVQDDGKIIGYDDPKLEERVVQICRNNCDPSILPTIRKISAGDNKILAVYIPKSTTVHANQKGQYYIRIGSTKQLPTRDELARLFQARSLVCFDEKPVESSQIQDLAVAKIDEYLHLIHQDGVDKSLLDNRQLLRNLKIVSGDFPTVAGLLFFARNIELSQSGITCAVYQGVDQDTRCLDQKEIEGSLPQVIGTALTFIESNFKVPSEINGIKREEYPEYAIMAVREAIVNAVAHRDYSITGSRIRLFLYANRLEILSPGGLPNTLTLENIKTIQYSRNPIIVSFLKAYGLMERRGEGIMRIIKWSIDNGAPEPRFELVDRNLFKVTIYKRN